MAGTDTRLETEGMAHSAPLLDTGGVPGSQISAWLRAAIAAPSIHNSQPWLFRPHDERIDVFADRRRRLAATDPDGREMYVSVGAALLNLRIAMLADGHRPLVRLLPDPARPDLAATVTIEPAVSATPQVRALAEAIPRRQTNRRPFGSTPIAQPILDDLAAAARLEGATWVTTDPATMAAVLSVARTAEHRRRADPRYRRELAEWTTPDPERTDGVPATAFGPRPQLAALPLRDFDLAHTTDRRVARFETKPTLAVLSTAGDTARDWLRAGQALERVLLTATARGVASTPLTQAIEIPELRDLLHGPTELDMVQSIVRFGYAGRVRQAPRRPLTDVVLPAPQ
jgi:nitroreductase